MGEIHNIETSKKNSEFKFEDEKNNSSELPDEIAIDLGNSNTNAEEQKSKDEETLKEVRKQIESIGIQPDTNESSGSISGNIMVNGEAVGLYSLRELEGNDIYISNIQIGFSEEEAKALRGKGIGTQIYEQIGEAMQQKGKRLVSTSWAKTQAGISPEALRVWEKLAAKGKAEIVSTEMGKIYDRFTGEEKIENNLPVYAYVNK